MTTVDSSIGEAAPRAPEASMEDSCSQAILKFHRPSSLDYRARYGLLISRTLYGPFTVVLVELCPKILGT